MCINYFKSQNTRNKIMHFFLYLHKTHENVFHYIRSNK